MKKQMRDERDGKIYPYVEIGNQTWMAKNLEYKGEDGAMGRCALAKQENCDMYGRLYTLNEMFCNDCEEQQWGVADPNALKNNIACPSGWHLPSTVEMEELWAYSDPNFVPGSEASGRGMNASATKLKATCWGGTDDLGFAGLPGGYCGDGCMNIAVADDNGGTRQLGIMSFWWSHAFGAPVPLAKSWRMTESTTSGGAAVDDAFQSYSTSAFYVRCLKNSNPIPKTPETPPQSADCSGIGSESQTCYFGKRKDSFTDERDGKKYPYVEIGGKTWMAKNLDYADVEGSACYNGLEKNCETYGRLYNWISAMELPPCSFYVFGTVCGDLIKTEHQGVCPEGWHIPSDAEWTALLRAVGGTGASNLTGASAFLKAESGWASNGTDNFGFAALPGGYGVLNAGNIGDDIRFGVARAGFWWSTTAIAANGSYIRHIGPTSANVTRIDNDFSRLYSIRCVKDNN
jgi:uncharacterized protein (TIGR02145 family)